LVNAWVGFEGLEIIHAHDPVQVSEEAGVAQKPAERKFDAVRKHHRFAPGVPQLP
jgi:hypothetical protein